MAKESLYDRSAWGYVFERVCHADSRYTATQRLVLLTLAKHMAKRTGQGWVCFLNDRKVQAETGLKRTAVKAARKGIRTITPAILKFERAERGKKLTTNGIDHGCYRYTLLHEPQAQGERQPVTVAEIGRRMTSARKAQIAEFVAEGLPSIVADGLRELLTCDEKISGFFQVVLTQDGLERVRRGLAASEYRSYPPEWELLYERGHGVLGRISVDTFGWRDVEKLLRRYEGQRPGEAGPPCSQPGSPDTPPEGRHATT